MSEKVEILGIKINNINAEEFKNDIIDSVISGIPKVIMYTNANSVNLAQADKRFKEILNSADILQPDGWGVIWASRFLRTPLKEKIVVTDFFIDFCRRLAQKDISLYLLGGRTGVAKQAKEKLEQMIPGLRVRGERHGYFDAHENNRIIDEINRSKADILLVGMETPRQEKWIYDNRLYLTAKACWAVGGLLDFISGRIKRAPQRMLDHHLEWLYRLGREPLRLWKRYLLGSPLFVCRVLKLKLLLGEGRGKK